MQKKMEDEMETKILWGLAGLIATCMVVGCFYDNSLSYLKSTSTWHWYLLNPCHDGSNFQDIIVF